MGKHRLPGPPPKIQGRGVSQYLSELQDWLFKLWKGVSVAPYFHDIDPEDVGIVNAPGTEDLGFTPPDHTHRLGIVAVKGDVIGHDGTNPVAVPIGTADGQVATVKATATPGWDWEAPAGVLAELFTGCVSFWRLDEATGLIRRDSIGQLGFNDLAPVNAPTQVGGKIGNAAQFVTASAQGLIITDAAQAGLNPHFGDFSLSLWIYPDALPAGSEYAVDKGCYANASPEQIGYSIGLQGSGGAFPGRVQVLFGAPPSTIIGGYFVSSTVPPIGSWTHLFWSIDRDGSMALFVNGVYNGTILAGSLVTASLDNTGDASSAAPFIIGGASATFSPTAPNSAYWNGRVDAVGYFNFAGGAAHAAALYNSGNGREISPLWGTRDPWGWATIQARR